MLFDALLDADKLLDERPAQLSRGLGERNPGPELSLHRLEEDVLDGEAGLLPVQQVDDLRLHLHGLRLEHVAEPELEAVADRLRQRLVSGIHIRPTGRGQRRCGQGIELAVHVRRLQQLPELRPL